MGTDSWIGIAYWTHRDIKDIFGSCSAYLFWCVATAELRRSRHRQAVTLSAAPSSVACAGPQPLAGKQVTRLPVRDHGLSPVGHDHVFTNCLSNSELVAASKTARLQNMPR